MTKTKNRGKRKTHDPQIEKVIMEADASVYPKEPGSIQKISSDVAGLKETVYSMDKKLDKISSEIKKNPKAGKRGWLGRNWKTLAAFGVGIGVGFGLYAVADSDLHFGDGVVVGYDPHQAYRDGNEWDVSSENTAHVRCWVGGMETDCSNMDAGGYRIIESGIRYGGL